MGFPNLLNKNSKPNTLNLSLSLIVFSITILLTVLQMCNLYILSDLPSSWCLWTGKRVMTGRKTAPVCSNNGCPQSAAAHTHTHKATLQNIFYWPTVPMIQEHDVNFYLVRVVVPALFSVPQPGHLQTIRSQEKWILLILNQI